MSQPESAQALEAVKTPAYFKEALEDAERLMKFAAERGVDVDPETRAAILHARSVFAEGWNEEIAARLLLALTQLASRLRPVTAASLKAYHYETRPTMHTYLIWAIILSAIIIPASVATFVTSSICIAIKGDIATANDLAAKLRTEIPPATVTANGVATPTVSFAATNDVITDLQDFASSVRLIYARANRLNRFVFPHVEVPESLKYPPQGGQSKAELDAYKKQTFELPVPLTDLPAAANKMTATYQDVRYYAQTLITEISMFYGAVTSCILPILYALLGTCAYLLRTFESQMSNRTFTPSAANSARFLIAAIGGTVIGLFTSFGQQVSASPLAVAFLVGYSVEVFFAFLEGLINAFTKTVPAAPTPPEAAPVVTNSAKAKVSSAA